MIPKRTNRTPGRFRREVFYETCLCFTAGFCFNLCIGGRTQDFRFPTGQGSEGNGGAKFNVQFFRFATSFQIFGLCGRERHIPVEKYPFKSIKAVIEGTQIDVAVNNPGEPVVLMLGAYEPTIWNIGWSQGTKILAVLVSGYHRQVVAGLDQQTPLLISSYDNRGPCGYFYVTPDNLESLNPKARSLFGRPVDVVYPAVNGNVVVGAPISADQTGYLL